MIKSIANLLLFQLFTPSGKKFGIISPLSFLESGFVVDVCYDSDVAVVWFILQEDLNSQPTII